MSGLVKQILPFLLALYNSSFYITMNLQFCELKHAFGFAEHIECYWVSDSTNCHLVIAHIQLQTLFPDTTPFKVFKVAITFPLYARLGRFVKKDRSGPQSLTFLFATGCMFLENKPFHRRITWG
ncbi:MAG: hypothetical protein D6732_05660 [Methanobacteriota archaeon]|nr:MAG: hypothetical protein D6732_05660 [Euryarchaeota archaeon]